MSKRDDYLWDGSGESDPEIQRLESVLGTLAHRGGRPVFPDASPEAAASGYRWWSAMPRPLRLAAMSAVLATAVIVVAAAWFAAHRARRGSAPGSEPPAAGWMVAQVTGAPRIDGSTIGNTMGELAPGHTLVTDNRSRARIVADETGEIEVDPGTRLRVVASGAQRKRLALDRGLIHAFIWSPPGEFMVDTPSATAVDMGCAYTLQVDDSGAGLLRTTLGWVGFKLDDRDAFIPAGAACATRPGLGPGTPYFEDAAPAFRTALAQFDFGPPNQRASALDTLLQQARERDSLTLWHLLARVDARDRARVYDQLARLVPPPDGVTREGVLRLDPIMLDAWWNALGLGDVSLWRTFERSWPKSHPQD